MIHCCEDRSTTRSVTHKHNHNLLSNLQVSRLLLVASKELISTEGFCGGAEQADLALPGAM